MTSVLLGLLAETSLHFGAGTSEGAVDLPLARESATGYPVLVASALKGALLDKAIVGKSGIDTDAAFGRTDAAGGLIVCDGRLLLLPVRSLQSPFKWITCPLILERLSRDAQRAGLGTKLGLPQGAIAVAAGQCLGAGAGELFLEEREFSVGGSLPAGLTAALGRLITHDSVKARLEGQVVVLNDTDFEWFARYGLPVTARNVLSDEKTSKNLWYEETLPPDTLLYSLLMGRNGWDLTAARQIFRGEPYLQAGGNETVGQGWLHVTEVC